jgi:hypothetical protein
MKRECGCMNANNISNTLIKNQFFILTAVIIFFLCLDVLMVKLPIYSITTRTSDLILGMFAIIVIISIIAQFIYFKMTLTKIKMNFGFFTLSDTTIKYIATISQSLIICLILTVFIQIGVLQSYYTEFIKYTMIISSVLSIFFISLLFIRFLLWYQASKNNVILLFTISTAAIIINSFLVVIFSHLAFLNVFQVMDPLIPSMNNIMFKLSALKTAYIISSTFEFVLILFSSILILKPYASNVGKIRIWFLVIIPMIYFFSKFQFYQSWLSTILVDGHILTPVSYFRFLSLFDVTSNVIGSLAFGITFWIISRRISDNSLRHFVQISGIGICLLFLSSQITNLILLPYPPFGLVSISFASIASYLLFIGLYKSAIITSRDSVIRSVINRSAEDEIKFIGNIGTSEMKYNISSQIRDIVKRFGDKIVEDNTYEINDLKHDVKDFVNMAKQALRDKELTSDNKNSKEISNDRICSNSNCNHRNDEHYSLLYPKSSGDPLDTSCRLCNCEKFQ